MNYTKTYKNVLKWRNTPVRNFLRNRALDILSLNVKLDKNFKGIQFLYFHYVYDDEIKNAGKIIKWIADNYKVISYSEAVKRIKNNTIDDYYICFSSDDGLKSNLIASKIFKKHNISCCYFVNPETIENRNKAFQNKICTERLGVPLTDLLTWDDVNTLIKEGHEIGNHSFDHEIQGDLSFEDFKKDFHLSNKNLEEKVGTIKHYAYPRGLFEYFKEEYLKHVYDCGYDSCATAVRGCHVPQIDNKTINNIAIRRDVMVFDEPLSYLKYFMKQSQKKASPINTFWKE